MLMEAVPVRLVTVPLEGVPRAPLSNTGAPAVPLLMASAVAMPVPSPVMLPTAGVMVLVVTAVTSPLALTVMAGAAVALP